ncbi:hypothetical protein Pmani_013796, partial [Petrolisthes manimaculis]
DTAHSLSHSQTLNLRVTDQQSHRAWNSRVTERSQPLSDPQSHSAQNYESQKGLSNSHRDTVFGIHSSQKGLSYFQTHRSTEHRIHESQKGLSHSQTHHRERVGLTRPTTPHRQPLIKPQQQQLPQLLLPSQTTPTRDQKKVFHVGSSEKTLPWTQQVFSSSTSTSSSNRWSSALSRLTAGVSRGRNNHNTPTTTHNNRSSSSSSSSSRRNSLRPEVLVLALRQPSAQVYTGTKE